MSGRPEYDIWVHDFALGTNMRITSDPASDWFATWSPDSNHIIFSSERGSSVFNLYQKASSGAGTEDLLFKSNQDKSAQDWSRDGKFLLYSVPNNGRRSYGPAASHDLWVLPLTGNQAERKPELYLGTEFNETQARFSPDGHLIAYASDASGRYEIYVQSFPTASNGKSGISTEGGIAPRWSRDGNELFYISADSKMMSVEVSTNPVFKAGIPKALFQVPIWGGGTTHNATRYDVTAGGKKFLINCAMAEGGASAPSAITVVQNWTALLKK
jgi:Tol biopolymer transport system component